MKLTWIFPLAGLVAASGAFLPSVKAVSYFDDFDDGNDAGWTRYSPIGAASESQPYGPGRDYPYVYVYGAGNTYSFPTESGSTAYKMTSIQVGGANPARVGSVYTNIAITDFTVEADLLNWTQTVKERMGLMGRYNLPDMEIPTDDASSLAYFGNGYGVWLYNKNGTGTTLQIEELDDFLGHVDISVGGNFDGLNGADTQPVPGGDYRLRFWGVGTNFYAQIINKSTGLAMKMNDGAGGITNTITATDSTFTNAGSGGMFGVIGTTAAPYTYTVDPTFDNFAVVSGVVTLETAEVVTGPYVVNPTAVIQLYPPRITIPVNGSRRFYRIRWLGGDHIPTITGITLVGSNVVLTYN